MNTSYTVLVPVSVLRTVTLYRPVDAPAGMTRFPVIVVEETTLILVRVIVVGLCVYVTVAPGWKLVPVRVIPTVVLCAPVAGVLLIVLPGLGLMTSKSILPDDCPSVLVT